MAALRPMSDWLSTAIPSCTWSNAAAIASSGQSAANDPLPMLQYHWEPSPPGAAFQKGETHDLWIWVFRSFDAFREEWRESCLMVVARKLQKLFGDFTQLRGVMFLTLSWNTDDHPRHAISPKWRKKNNLKPLHSPLIIVRGRKLVLRANTNKVFLTNRG